MKKIISYLKERKNFSNHYGDFVKEVEVITSTPSDKVTEATLKNAISLLHKGEESIKKMDELMKSMNGLEKMILHDIIIEMQFEKDCFDIRKDILITLEEVVKS